MITEDVVRYTASSVLRQNRGYVDFDDLCQIGRMWIFEHPGKMAELDAEEEKLAYWRLGRLLMKEMVRYAQKEKAAVSGYDFDDLAFYSRRSIDTMLPYVLAGDPNPPTGESVGTHSVADPAEGGQWLASYLDVKRAWENAPLSSAERRVLFALHRYGWTQAAVADELMLTQQSVSQMARRGLERLSDELGGAKPLGCPYDCECHEGKLRRRPGAHGFDNGLNQMFN